VAIQIQEELVDLDKRIPRTEAGKLLRCTMQEFLEMQNKDADETDPEIQ
jgi:acyl-coenzyme A synthetase/AMP-(fatty) acid ligase